MNKKSKHALILPIVLTVLVIIVSYVGITSYYRWKDVQDFIKGDFELDYSSDVSSEDKEPEIPVDPAIEAERLLNDRIDSIMEQMSLEQKVGELFMLRADDSQTFLDTLAETHAGGTVLFAKEFKNKTPDAVIAMTAQMQAASDGKMFMAVDEEGGIVVRLSSNSKLRATKFKSPSAVFASGGMEAVKNDTVEKCEFLRKYGINMNFAPVADVCTDPKGVMYKRAFQKGADETAEYVSTVVTTMKQNGVIGCVKHFPGYGNSQGDTHNGLDVNEKSLDELQSVDLVPFKRAIQDGVDCIMVTHTIINAIDSERPASLSSKVINGVIREQLGFDGLVVSDGMDMGAIVKFSGNSGRACVDAILAGNDLLCTPTNAVEDYRSVLEAVNSGEISEERIEQSVRRIIRLKIEYGMYDQ